MKFQDFLCGLTAGAVGGVTSYYAGRSVTDNAKDCLAAAGAGFFILYGIQSAKKPIVEPPACILPIQTRAMERPGAKAKRD